jgi:cobalt-precorrin-5B (C1)-methyltransferase
LKEGITTGSCAAPLLQLPWSFYQGISDKVTIDLPDIDKSISVAIFKTGKKLVCNDTTIVSAAVIKNAGDDPDITNGAMVGVHLKIKPNSANRVIIKGGKGVGTVTRPGLLSEKVKQPSTLFPEK